MDHNHQYIPFPVPEHLAQFLAFKLNTKIRKENGLQCIMVTRHPEIGKLILRSLSTDPRRAARNTEGIYFLKVSNFAGDHYPNTPDGTRNFLKLENKIFEMLRDHLKTDLEESLFHYVQGAEFAHRKNGWNPVQKRKGIRKHAITEFCKKNHVSPDKRSFDSLFKMVQRRISLSKAPKTKGLKMIAEILSF